MNHLAMLLSLLGPGPGGRPGVNLPSEPVLHRGDQIVAIGDSITAEGGYLKIVEAVLSSRHPELELPPILNAGVSAQKAEDLAARFRADVIDRTPDVVLISVGINDVWHRADRPHDPKHLAEYRANVARMVDMARKAGIRVVLLGPTVIGEDAAAEANRRLRLYVDAEADLARDRGCTMVDLHRMSLAALARRPADVADGPRWLTRDDVHMSPVGDALMAIGVLRGLGIPDSDIAEAGR